MVCVGEPERVCVCEPVRVCVEERVRDTEGVDGAERVCVAVSEGVERGLIVTLALCQHLRIAMGSMRQSALSTSMRHLY